MAADGPCVAVLPEMFTCPYELERFEAYAEELPDGETGRFLARSFARSRR